VRRTYTF